MNTGYIFIKHNRGGIISITKDAICTHLLSKGILLLGFWHLCFFTNHKIKTLFVMFLYSMPNQYRVTELEGKRKKYLNYHLFNKCSTINCLVVNKINTA